MSRNRNTYDTSFMVAYSMGIRGAMYDNVPRSTKIDWVERSHDHIHGFDQICGYVHMINTAEENKRLKQMLISIYRLFVIYRCIVNNLPDRNQKLFVVKDKIIGSTERWIKDFRLKRIVQLLDISQQQYSSWKKGYYCKYSPVMFCRRIFSNQLTIKEIDLIKKYVQDPKYQNWSLISIYYILIRETGRFFSDKTFYKYVKLMGLRSKKKNHKQGRIGPRASKPLELLHMDISEYWITDNIRVYLHIIMDNYSRKILGLRVAMNKSSSLACQNLKDVYESLDLSDRQEIMVMMNDSGSENMGETKTYIESLPNMRQHFATRIKHDCSNNMIEALISKVKQCFIYPKEFTSLENFSAYLMDAIEIYNKEMPLAAINGRTPNEAFKGIIPFDKHLSELIQMSHYERIVENKNGNCF